MRKISSFLIILIFIFIQSCENKQTNKSNIATSNNKKIEKEILKLESPLNGSNFTTSDNLVIKYTKANDSILLDSVTLQMNNEPIGLFKESSYTLPLAKSKMGLQRLSLTAYQSSKQVGSLSFVITVKPQNPPKTYTYKVIKEYPHAKNAYTQGLYFNNGFLYEGTGEYGGSSLRKVDLQTGNVLKSINIDKKYFGEGICLLNNKIYQITWREHTGFIYNAETFEKIGEFNYPTEGWGLTTDGTHLIMSDGSANLYFLDPSNFKVVKKIEAYTFAGSVTNINELEYINNEIWANIYLEDTIVIINPETGEVTSLIDLSGILKVSDKDRNIDVLNGIAYDFAQNKIFVTGKRWAKLFEIKIIENKK